MRSHHREIAAIALPAIVSNITTPLLSMVDMAIVGHLGSVVFIGAIALGGSMFSMVYWLFGFLRTGSSGMTAQAYGRGDTAESAVMFYRSLSLGFVIGLIILALSVPIADGLLAVLDGEPDTIAPARTYFLIAVFGAPATLATYAMSGWYVGMQDSRTPMWMALIINVVNIASSLIMVFVLDMGIVGVAAGSATAQWIGFFFGLAVALRSYKPSRPSLVSLIDCTGLKRFFSINTDIFLRTTCLIAVTVWFTHAGSVQSVDILAANAVLLQLFLIFSYFMDGFAFAGEALAGKHLGRGDSAALKQLITTLMHIAAIMAVAFSVIYYFCGSAIVELLTDEPAVVDTCRRYMVWAAIVPLAGTAAFVWDGILVGLTLTRIMLVSMAIATAAYFAIYFVAHTRLGNHGLWLAFIVYLALRGIFEAVLYHHNR